MKAHSHAKLWFVAAMAAVSVCSGITRADEIERLLYSFESGLQGWAATSSALTTSTTLGVTDGAQSMLMNDLSGGFKNNPAGMEVISGQVFSFLQEAANAVAGGDPNVKLEFDFAWDNSLATNATYAQLALYMNSTGQGYKEYQTGQLIGGNIGSSFPTLAQIAIDDGVTFTSTGTNRAHVAIPLGPRVTIGPGSFYQMGFKTNGVWDGSVDWAIDKVKITGITVVPTTSETLFSWETPDDNGTPAVDERFELWTTGFQTGHTHSITTIGATDGTHALQIDRTTQGSGFSWGSQFQISSDTDPGPGEVIDPVIQARIDELADKILSADRVAFDVTYQYVDRFPLPDPTAGGTNFYLNFSDETGVFYQAATAAIDVLNATQQTTTTLEIPLSQFTASGGLNLLEDGFVEGTNYLRITLATNTDGAQIYQIDNFRLLTEVPQGVPGDYNNNGVVDGADYVVWRDHLGQTFQLQNEVTGTTTGTVTPEDYTAWRARFGNISGSGSLAGGAAVPEPSSLALLFVALMGSLLVTRRST